jgi:hypothetical protein
MTVNTPFFADISPQKPFSRQEEEIGEVCIPNISPLERRKRLNFAIRQFITSLVVLGVLIVLDVNPLWRLPLFLMFSASAVSYFQARDKT